MKRINFENITAQITEPYSIIGSYKNKYISNVKNISNANSESLVWVSPLREDRQDLVEETKAELIICDNSIEFTDHLIKNKCFIVVDNPRLVFIKIVNALLLEEQEWGIHPSAIIHPEAKIHNNVFIGPYTIIGKSEIDENSIIHGHCYIYDNVKIGKNVIIQAGCLIGIEGFGLEKDENGRLIKFPQIGGVIIEDDVEIQGMTNVDRGTLSDTIIGRGTKIDTHCHIGHNNIIGEDNVITARAMLGGSNIIGNRCWIGPCTTIIDGGLKIDDDSFIGIGSLIIKDIQKNERVMGHPAKPIDEYKKMLYKLRELIKE